MIKSAVLLQTWSNLLKKSLIKEPHFLCSAMLNKSVCKPSKVFPDVIINQKCSDISQKIFWDELNFYESLCFYWKFFRKVLAVKQTPSKKCRYSKFFWSFLSRIGTEYGDLLCKSADLLCKSLYSVQAQENMDQENSEYVHVLHGVCFLIVEEPSVKTEILQLESCCPQAFYKFNFSETSSETSVVEPIVAL